MLRESFAALLLGTWVNLSGVELVEDFDRPRQVSVPIFTKDSTPGVDLPNDPLEFADLTTPFGPAAFQLSAVSSRFDKSAVEKKAGKIYLLFRVFLI